jgi:delta24(24(1))-sterol reductase
MPARGRFNGHSNGKTAPNTFQEKENPTFNDGYSEEFEFGGSLGAIGLMIGFPILMWYMWIGATYYNGKLPLPKENETLSEFAQHLVNLVYEGSYPTTKAWIIYWMFFVVEILMYCYMPGVSMQGRPLPHEDFKRLPYYCSAYSSFYTTILIVAVLPFTKLFPLSCLIAIPYP